MVSARDLQKSPLFSGLDRDALGEIAAALATESWPAHQEILPPTRTSERFLVILHGRVKIVASNGHNGRELTLWLLGPGDAFDIVSLLDGKTHAVSAWTLDPVEVLSAPLPLFRKWVERYPRLRAAILKYVARQLREIAELAGDLALHDTMTRLVHLLLRHLGSGKDDGPEEHAARTNLIRDLSHEEIASLIGSVRVVVNRLLSELRRDAAVVLHEGSLRVGSLKQLVRRAARRFDAPNQRSRI